MFKLGKFSKKVATLTAVVSLGAAFNASAASISFGGQTPTDGSGLTSSFVDPSNLLDGSTGYFIETFDAATQTVGVGLGSTAYNDPGFDDCAVNGTAAGIVVTPPSSTVGVRQGTVPNVAAAPANDETCFAYLTNAGVGGTTSFTLDYNVLLDANDDTGITYLGFYWGSVDTYNDFEFYSDGSLISGSGLLSDGVLTGTELLNALGGSSGDQEEPESNVYVNIFFSFAEQFDTLVVNTRGIAGEFDNLVIGLSNRPPEPVPAPAGIAMFAFGLIALSIRNRMKKA